MNSNLSRRQFISRSAAGASAVAMAATGVAEGFPERMSGWRCVLELDTGRRVSAGSQEGLQKAIRSGADLRIYTEFKFNEHVDVASSNDEIVRECSDFRVTYLLEDRWVAAVMTQRMPIDVPDGFGPRASMSLFMYGQDGRQAIARPFLDGLVPTGTIGPAPLGDHHAMPKYHQLDGWDAETNAPSSNFVYDFEVYRYWVRDDWQELLSHTAEGEILSGTADALGEALEKGRELKVGIRGICADLADNPGQAMDHEVFIRLIPGFYFSRRRLFAAETELVVRVRPAIPMRYQSRGWDFGCLMPRSDGFVARWLCDPYTLQFKKSEGRYAIRWFVR